MKIARTILSFVSRHTTLYPGDVVITGTPKGVAAIKPGDQVAVEIEGIGRLSNPVVSAGSPQPEFSAGRSFSGHLNK